MPFGLDLKSMIVGALIWAFVVPWILGIVSSRRSNSPSAA